jgi:hypothetical protein
LLREWFLKELLDFRGERKKEKAELEWRILENVAFIRGCGGGYNYIPISGTWRNINEMEI